MKLSVTLNCAAPVPLAAQFDCAAGELVALVGPSGSGKTSLLRAIAGLAHPGHPVPAVKRPGAKAAGNNTGLQGHISVGDAVWFDSELGICLPPQLRRCGLVFQQYALFPHLNAINNVAAYADNTWPVAKKRAFSLDLLARLGMAQLGQRLPHQLSGGQQQRVALARALMRVGSAQNPNQATGNPVDNTAAPGVLLLDEPFSAVDAPMRQSLYRELAQLRQSLRLPIVLVTHDLHEARRLADRVVIVDAGSTLQTGPPERVLRSPRNARVADLVGIHNHFSGRFYSATSHAGLGSLHWGSIQLQVQDKSKIPNDTPVTWVLAGDLVQLGGAYSGQSDGARTGALNDAVREGVNYLDCVLTEALPLGEISLCKLSVTGAAPAAVTLNLSTVHLRALGAVVGSGLQLAIPPQAVHIMPLR